MRIAVITDVHANLPALEAVLSAIKDDGYDAIFHAGDAIAIGPYPAECLDLLLNQPNVHFVLGNHDAYFAHGIPDPRPPYMDEGEVEHQLWTHSQLDPHLRRVVAQWPYSLAREFEVTNVAFLHYALDESGTDFKPVVRDGTGESLDALFSANAADLVFYGHHHAASDIQGRARYLNPGSLGCFDKPLARYYGADFWRGGYNVKHRVVEYDDAALAKAFRTRRVPASDFIRKTFFGGRF